MPKSASTRAALLPYPIIAAAVRGEPEAVNTVVRFYSGYIAALSMRTSYDAFGCPHSQVDSLRHSSTTYKLKLNHGDLKATQGDTGHAEIDMITSIYAHILDEDRKVNAQKFESAFYSNPDLRGVRPPEEPKESAPLDLASLVEQLQKSPELASALAALIAQQAGPAGK